MKITCIPAGMLLANCYVIETENKNAVIVDAGGDFEKLKRFLTENELSLKKILLTHGHFDHIGAVQQLSEYYKAEVFIHEDDAVMLSDRTLSLADSIGSLYKPVEKFTTITDGDVIKQDELSFEVIHTPGHTMGGVCYKCGGSLFTGDTLFKLSMGRTDFPSGSAQQLLNSLKKLADLDGDFDVYPGHNNTTTLDFERKNNSYLKGNPYENII